MSFQPVVPFGGYSGWAFLNRTREAQQETFNRTPQMQRETDYFAENIGKIKTAEELVADRRLLGVALGAFGLDEDINNKFFIQKILEEGSTRPDALANKLSDKRYLAFAKAFGFDEPILPNTSADGFSDNIIQLYKDKQFEIAVGQQNPDMRLALGLGKEIEAIAALQTTGDGRWFTVMGNAPVRKVFETALGMPAEIGRLDIDQQLTIFKDRARQMFGTDDMTAFAKPEMQETLIRNFLVRTEISANQSSITGASAALVLLQGVQMNKFP